jgi:hypothetical protein
MRSALFHDGAGPAIWREGKKKTSLSQVLARQNRRADLQDRFCADDFLYILRD